MADTQTRKRVQKEYGFQSSYPEDIKYNARALKIAEELRDLEPTRKPIDMDEEDPDENKYWNNLPPKHEALYGKRVDIFQQNPIDLYESEAGRKDLTDSLNKNE